MVFHLVQTPTMNSIVDQLEDIKAEIRQKCNNHMDFSAWITDINQRIDGVKRTFTEMESKMVELEDARVQFKKTCQYIQFERDLGPGEWINEDGCYFSDSSLECSDGDCSDSEDEEVKSGEGVAEEVKKCD